VSHVPIPAALVAEALRSSWRLPVADADVCEIPPGATASVFLVRVGGETFVAKFAYDERAYFEAGLRVSELVDGFPVATPVRASDGAWTTMLEWPAGLLHPLALLRFVPGDPIEHDRPDAPELLGSVCGAVHSQLLTLDPSSVGVAVPDEAVGDVINDWDVGDELRWLDGLAVEVVARARSLVAGGGLRLSVGVWDGPDVRVREDGSVGLIDFGHTFWGPLVHFVANRSLIAAYDDAAKLERFFGAVERSGLRLTTEELAALPVFRSINAVIYARWAASTGSAPAWLQQLVRFLRSSSAG
jgi:Ser/Thr protein kinase RdoA (MazF antagonist)